MNGDAVRQNSPGIQVKSILFATDFSSASTHAFPLAAALSRCFAAKLFVVHVIAHQVRPDDVTFGPPASLEDRASAEHKMKSLTQSDLLRGVDCTTLVVEGRIGELLNKVIDEHRIDMAVVGTTAASGLKRILFGSGAEQIYRHATCSILVVGPNATHFGGPGVFENVLVPIDFSEASLSALPFAELLAGPHGRIVLLHVLSEIDPRFERTIVKNCNQRLRGLVSDSMAFAADRAGIRQPTTYEFKCATDLGETSEVILRHSDQSGAGVIVMGVHPTNSPATQMPWKSVRDVVRGAQCPVLVVKYSGGR